MNRRHFLGLSGAAALTSAVGSGASTAAQIVGSTIGEIGPLRERPNIILFMPDELRADSLACYGNPLVRTPNFDRLAASGTRFNNCNVQFPVCGASRCSMLTGW